MIGRPTSPASRSGYGLTIDTCSLRAFAAKKVEDVNDEGTAGDLNEQTQSEMGFGNALPHVVISFTRS
jgi:hypothetical protein